MNTMAEQRSNKQIRIGKFAFDKDDLLVALVVIGSLSLRNFQYLLYVFQVLFLLIIGMKLFARCSAQYFVINVLFLTVCFASALWADDASAVFPVLISLVQIYLICIVMYGYFTDVQKIENLITIIILASVVLSVNILISTPINEFREIIEFAQDSGNAATDEGRLGMSVNMHPNGLGSVLMIEVGCVFYRWLKTKQWRYIFLNVILLVFLFLTKSRSSLLEAFVICAFVFVFCIKSGPKKLIAIVAVGLGAVVAIWAVMNIPILYDIVGFRFEGIILGLSSDDADASTVTRMRFIEIAFDLFTKNPLLGVGLNNFSVVAYRDYNIWTQTYAHNTYAELLADLGIFGIVLYYTLRVKALVSLWRSNRSKVIRSNPNSRMLCSFLLAIAIVSFVIDFTHITYNSEAIQYLYLMVVVGSVRLEKIRKQSVSI